MAKKFTQQEMEKLIAGIREAYETKIRRLNSRLGRGGLSAVREEGETRGGVALVNVDDRIRLLFGSEYGLHVFSIPGSGTDVEITLPAITSDREIPNQEALS